MNTNKSLSDIWRDQHMITRNYPLFMDCAELFCEVVKHTFKNADFPYNLPTIQEHTQMLLNTALREFEQFWQPDNEFKDLQLEHTAFREFKERLKIKLEDFDPQQTDAAKFLSDNKIIDLCNVGGMWRRGELQSVLNQYHNYIKSKSAGDTIKDCHKTNE